MLLCWPRQQSSSWEEPGINASLDEGMANEKKNMHRLGTFPSQQLSVSIWACACSQKNLPGVLATKLSHKDIKPYQNQLFDQSKKDDTCWNKWITLKSWFGAQGVDIYIWTSPSNLRQHFSLSRPPHHCPSLLGCDRWASLPDHVSDGTEIKTVPFLAVSV